MKETMNRSYLQVNEFIVAEIEGVSRSVSTGGSLFGKSFVPGDFLLTNCNIIFVEKKTNPFAKEKDVFSCPIEQILTYCGMAQAQVSQSGGRKGNFHLTIYCRDSKEEFSFSYEDKQKLQQLVERINEIRMGTLDTYDPEKVGFRLSVNKKIASAVRSAKPIAADLADISKPFVQVAAATSTIRTTTSGRIVNKALDVVDTISDKVNKNSGMAQTTEAGLADQGSSPERAFGQDMTPENTEFSESQESTMTFDEQIDALKKLKELVDAGVLTQDEFNTKKKNIMGL